LQLAEETLTACRGEPSPDRRRVMVASAMNHLRQVLAATLPGRLPWWTVELHTDLLVDELRRHPDPVHGRPPAAGCHRRPARGGQRHRQSDARRRADRDRCALP
jgi:hypothetical protein